MCLISYKNNGSSRAVTEKMKVRAGSVELSWLSLATKFLNGQKLTCATYSHGTMQILLQIAALFAVQKLLRFWFSAFVFFRFWPREIRRVKPEKILNVKLLVISIFIFKWCRDRKFPLSRITVQWFSDKWQFSSQSLSVKFTRKVYWPVWKHTIEKLVNCIHSSELW